MADSDGGNVSSPGPELAPPRMRTQQVEYDVLNSVGGKLGSLPVTRVTKARGSALFITSTTVGLLIDFFLHNERQLGVPVNPKTCLKVLTMLMLRSTAAREHVVVQKSPHHPDERISACITFTYRHGQRRDVLDEANHWVTELPDDDDYRSLCTIHWLLLWAVFAGAVDASSVDELRETISAPSFHRIQWTHSNRLVLCASGQDGELEYDSPAQAHHLESYIRAITRNVPALHDMKCSALRWGSIYEEWKSGRLAAAMGKFDECPAIACAWHDSWL